MSFVVLKVLAQKSPVLMRIFICISLCFSGCALQRPDPVTVYQYSETFDGDVLSKAVSAATQIGFEVGEASSEGFLTNVIESTIAESGNCGTYLGSPIGGPSKVQLRVKVHGQTVQVWATVYADVIGQDDYGRTARHQYQCRSTGSLERRFLAALRER